MVIRFGMIYLQVTVTHHSLLISCHYVLVDVNQGWDADFAVTTIYDVGLEYRLSAIASTSIFEEN